MQWDKVEILLLDFDGTIAGPKLWGPDGIALKPICGRDGAGIGLMRKIGVPVCVVTNEYTPITMKWCEYQSVEFHHVPNSNSKLPIVMGILNTHNILPVNACYVGDDVSDIPPMNAVGLPVAVANAHPALLNGDYYITKYPGGGGAVREVCDHIYMHRGGIVEYRSLEDLEEWYR